MAQSTRTLWCPNCRAAVGAVVGNADAADAVDPSLPPRIDRVASTHVVLLPCRCAFEAVRWSSDRGLSFVPIGIAADLAGSSAADSHSTNRPRHGSRVGFPRRET